MNTMTTLCIDLDDLKQDEFNSYLYASLQVLVPDIKITHFFIPYYCSPKFIQQISNQFPWMQFVPHGIQHKFKEFENISYAEMITHLTDLENIYKECLVVHGMKAPHWAMGQEAYRALHERDWWVAVDQDEVVPFNLTYYKHNCGIHHSFMSYKQLIKAHGHTTGVCQNGIEQCFAHLVKEIESISSSNRQFKFVTDLLEN